MCPLQGRSSSKRMKRQVRVLSFALFVKIMLQEPASCSLHLIFYPGGGFLIGTSLAPGASFLSPILPERFCFADWFHFIPFVISQNDIALSKIVSITFVAWSDAEACRALTTDAAVSAASAALMPWFVKISAIAES